MNVSPNGNVYETQPNEGPSAAATWTVLFTVAALVVCGLLWLGFTLGPVIKGMFS